MESKLGCGEVWASAQQALAAASDHAPQFSKGDIIRYSTRGGLEDGLQRYAVAYDSRVAIRHNGATVGFEPIAPGAEHYRSPRNPKHADIIFTRALDRVDHGADGRGVPFNTSEHFAAWCMYGVHVLEFPAAQADPAEEVASMLAGQAAWSPGVGVPELVGELVPDSVHPSGTGRRPGEEPTSTSNSLMPSFPRGAIIRYRVASTGESAEGYYHYAVVYDASTAIGYNGEVVSDEVIEPGAELVSSPSSLPHANRIVRRALTRVGEASYHPLYNNGELLARWCYSGDHSLAQREGVSQCVRKTVSRVVKAFAWIGLGGIVGLPLRIGLVFRCCRRWGHRQGSFPTCR